MSLEIEAETPFRNVGNRLPIHVFQQPRRLKNVSALQRKSKIPHTQLSDGIAGTFCYDAQTAFLVVTMDSKTSVINTDQF